MGRDSGGGLVQAARRCEGYDGELVPLVGFKKIDEGALKDLRI